MFAAGVRWQYLSRLGALLGQRITLCKFDLLFVRRRLDWDGMQCLPEREGMSGRILCCPERHFRSPAGF